MHIDYVPTLTISFLLTCDLESRVGRLKMRWASGELTYGYATMSEKYSLWLSRLCDIARA